VNASIHQPDRPLAPGRFTWLRHQPADDGASWIKFNPGTPQSTDGIDLQGELDVLKLMAVGAASKLSGSVFGRRQQQSAC
jgi:hypothetical protein